MFIKKSIISLITMFLLLSFPACGEEITIKQKDYNTLQIYIKLKLYKGNVSVIGRDSKTNNLFNEAFCTFEEDEVYNQKDAAGFIKLNALRFIISGKNRKKQGN